MVYKPSSFFLKRHNLHYFMFTPVVEVRGELRVNKSQWTLLLTPQFTLELHMVLRAGYKAAIHGYSEIDNSYNRILWLIYIVNRLKSLVAMIYKQALLSRLCHYIIYDSIPVYDSRTG